MTVKKCYRCKELKPLNMFHKDNARKTKVGTYCKSCKQILGKERFFRDKIRQRKYAKTHYQNNKEHVIERIKQVQLKDKEALKARYILRYALISGKINCPDICDFCKENKKLYGHHADYSKPLDVIWLCRSCHMRYHRNKESDVKEFIEKLKNELS